MISTTLYIFGVIGSEATTALQMYSPHCSRSRTRLFFAITIAVLRKMDLYRDGIRQDIGEWKQVISYQKIWSLYGDRCTLGLGHLVTWRLERSF